MGRLQSIEKALQEINPTIFQELCDSFLLLRNENYKAFSRIGSQTGKQKTTRGTPDSFFLLPNGNYIFVEVTTDISTKDKLANDIKACFNAEKSKIPTNKIEEIILCFNWNIDITEIEKLNKLANSFKYDVSVSYWPLDSLSIELNRNHRDLVKEYLGLCFDTGQIVSLDRFVAEYSNAAQGIATRIDNVFLHRGEEKQELKNRLNDSNFIILTGSPGVGKTKLALEGIKEYLKENNNFNAYCVSYKSAPLLQDLHQYVDKDKNYLLFVDDANRIDAFEQILGFYKETRQGQLKIIMTVRDYAYDEIKYRCLDFNPKTIKLNKLNDEQIVDIIKSDNFGIIHSSYQKKIVRIADGNPRIAIMASLLALKHHSIHSLSDVAELFENYFATFIKDRDEFANSFNIKCLGIIAFFNNIPYKDRNTSNSILSNFDIDYLEFVSVIDRLENLELVEIQFDYVKIPEQNLANFFFYKSFIQDNLLSFDILLLKFFANYTNRFRDCVIPANNTFGAEKVANKLRPKLKNYLSSIQSNEEYSYKFLSSFWFYLEPETLEYLFKIIDKLPYSNTTNTNYIFSELNCHSPKTNDKTIDLLSNFIRFHNNLKDAIELFFEYIRKCPDLFSELICLFNKLLIFSVDDARSRYGFYRQTTLFELLIKGLENQDKLVSSIFWQLSKTFLGYSFESSQMGRNNTFVISTYSIPNDRYIQDIRSKIWKAIDSHFNQFPEQALEVLKSYSTKTPDVVKEIMEFDLPYVLEIIKKHLTKELFPHCFYVQEQIRWWKRNKIYNSDFDNLTHYYTNPIYEMYLKIFWDRYRDKEYYEFDNWGKYNVLKEAEIKNSFCFESINEIKIFFQYLSIILDNFKKRMDFTRSLKIIINETFNNNFELGYAALDMLLDSEIDEIYRSILEFLFQLDKLERIEDIWQLIARKNLKNKVLWKLEFFHCLNINLITDIYIRRIIETIELIKSPTTIQFYKLKKYLELDPLLFQKILKIVYIINSEREFIIRLSDELFSNYFEYLGDDLNLIKQAYIQQDTSKIDFDYRGKGFLKILQQDINFLFEYVEKICQEKDRYSRLSTDGKSLGFIWSIKEIETQLIKIFDLLIDQRPYLGRVAHWCNVFFMDVNSEYDSQVKDFIMQYIKDNHASPEKINLIIDITRHSKNELFEDVLLYYVSLNQDVAQFRQIYWRGNVTTWIYDENPGDIEAADWKKILSIVEKSNVGFKLIPIKKYLNEQIESCLEYAEFQRKRKFLGKF